MVYSSSDANLPPPPSSPLSGATVDRVLSDFQQFLRHYVNPAFALLCTVDDPWMDGRTSRQMGMTCTRDRAIDGCNQSATNYVIITFRSIKISKNRTNSRLHRVHQGSGSIDSTNRVRLRVSRSKGKPVSKPELEQQNRLSH